MITQFQIRKDYVHGFLTTGKDFIKEFKPPRPSSKPQLRLPTLPLAASTLNIGDRVVPDSHRDPKQPGAA